MKYSYLSDSPDLLSELQEFASVSVPDREVTETVSAILKEIRLRGDAALLEKTLLYDGASLEADDISVTPAELDQAQSKLDASERAAILEAIANVRLFHEKSFPNDWSTLNEHGAEVGEKHYPIKRVGIYVPGGNVPLVSTVIMTVTLAKVAQVDEIAVVTPPDSNGKVAFSCWPPLESWGLPKFTGWEGPKRSPLWPLGPSPFQPSTRYSARAMPT
mgnify:CR=1 FL=1